MNVFIKKSIITDMSIVLEEMLKSVKNICKSEEDMDMDLYFHELEKFKMLLKKEDIILNLIPNDEKVLSVVRDLVKDSSNYQLEDSNNFAYVCARFLSDVNLLNYNLSIKENEIKSDNSDAVQYFIINNLLAEYVKSFQKSYEFASKSDMTFFRKIQYYNIFVSKYCFDNFVQNGFDFDNIYVFSEKEICKKFNLEKEEYDSIYNQFLNSNVVSLINVIARSSSSLNEIVSLDQILNFKFLIKKLPTEDLLSLKDDIVSSVNSNPTFVAKELLKSFVLELKIRDDVIIDKTNDDSLSPLIYNKVVDLIKIEEKIFDEFENIDFDTVYDLNSFSSLIALEKEYVSDITQVDLSFISTVELIFSDLWIYLRDDENLDRKVSLIKQRLIGVLPFFNTFYVPSSLSLSSYSSIFRNYMVKNIRDFYDMIVGLEDDGLRKTFISIYKDNFFVYPFLTDELVLANGNHRLIDCFDGILSLEGLTPEIEYDYDKNIQLYNMVTGCCDYLAENEAEIETFSDYANFQFQVISFVNAVNGLNADSLIKLKKYVRKSFTLFSPLRRDLLKVVDLGIENLEDGKQMKMRAF